MFSFVILAFLAIVSSHVYAQQTQFPFNVTVGNSLLFPSQMLSIPAGPVVDACTSTCSAANQTLTTCSDTDYPCLCAPAAVDALVNCETCMFHFLIDKNIPAPDPRAGSNVLVGGYTTLCTTLTKAKFSANQTALALPPTWDGPFVSVLPTGGVALTVIAGAFLAFSALYIMSNLDILDT